MASSIKQVVTGLRGAAHPDGAKGKRYSEGTTRSFELRSPPGMPQPYGFELPVASADGLVRGRIDRVIESPNGPIIQDFKTGNVYDAQGNLYRTVRLEYQVQLRLYAALYFEVYGAWAAALELVPLQGEIVPVSLDRTDAVRLLAEAKERSPPRSPGVTARRSSVAP